MARFPGLARQRIISVRIAYCIHGGEQGSTGYVKRKWRVVVDQLATLKADHNVNCQQQLRFGCLITVARTEDRSRSGPKVRR